MHAWRRRKTAAAGEEKRRGEAGRRRSGRGVACPRSLCRRRRAALSVGVTNACGCEEGLAKREKKYWYSKQGVWIVTPRERR